MSSDSNNSILWEISGKGNFNSYLCGTKHIVEKEYLEKRKERLYRALNNTEQILFEIDYYSPENQEKSYINYQKISKMKDTNLEFLLGEKRYKIANDIFKEKIDSNGLDDYKQMYPIFLESFFLMGDGSKQYISFEQELCNKSKSNIIKTLDSFEFLSKNVFEKLSKEDMAEMFFYNITNLDKVKEKGKLILETYNNESIFDMCNFTLSNNSRVDKEFKEVLINNRNKYWIPKIKEAIDDKPSFIAVGAAHLAGKYGLINLLEKEGYKLKPIK